jgi:hypothetical protein
MTILEAIIAGDVCIDHPYEEVKFRWVKAERRVFRRFYGEAEVEVDPASQLYHDAIRAGGLISLELYYRD